MMKTAGDRTKKVVIVLLVIIGAAIFLGVWFDAYVSRLAETRGRTSAATLSREDQALQDAAIARVDVAVPHAAECAGAIRDDFVALRDRAAASPQTTTGVVTDNDFRRSFEVCGDAWETVHHGVFVGNEQLCSVSMDLFMGTAAGSRVEDFYESVVFRCRAAENS